MRSYALCQSLSLSRSIPLALSLFRSLACYTSTGRLSEAPVVVSSAHMLMVTARSEYSCMWRTTCSAYVCCFWFSALASTRCRVCYYYQTAGHLRPSAKHFTHRARVVKSGSCPLPCIRRNRALIGNITPDGRNACISAITGPPSETERRSVAQYAFPGGQYILARIIDTGCTTAEANVHQVVC